MALDEAAINQAASLLLQHWQSWRTMPGLPAECRPQTRAEAYAIQQAMLKISGREHYGWKIAATSRAGQLHIGVDGPLAGRLHANQVLASGSQVPISASQMKVAEVEFAFRMKHRLAPRTDAYSEQDVMQAVGSLHTAIEIPDSRYSDFAKAGAAQLTAENACADRFMLGAECADSWRSIDLSRHTVKVSVTGRAPVEGIGSNVLGDPRTALTWLVNELSRHGIALEAGDVVTTGTCVVPIPVEPGVTIDADYGVLGSIRASFV